MTRPTLSRRGLLAAGALAPAALATPALSQNRQELRMVTSWPKNLPGVGTAAERFAERLTTMSDGRLTVRVFAAGELVPAFETFDAVATGTADIAHTASFYHLSKSRAAAFFTGVPFGLVTDEYNAWIKFGGGQELWDELYGEFGLRAWNVGNSGTQMAGWFANPINSVDDMQGLRFRSAGLGGEVLRQVGVNVVNLPGGEIFAALQAGTIDGTKWVAPWSDLAFGFHRVLSNYHYPGVLDPGAAIELIIGRERFDEMPADLQQMLVVACNSENEMYQIETRANNAASLRVLTEEHGVNIAPLPDDVIIALGNAAGEVVASLGDDDDISRRILESYVAFRNNALPWSGHGEFGYGRARALDYNYPS